MNLVYVAEQILHILPNSINCDQGTTRGKWVWFLLPLAHSLLEVIEQGSYELVSKKGLDRSSPAFWTLGPMPWIGLVKSTGEVRIGHLIRLCSQVVQFPLCSEATTVKLV